MTIATAHLCSRCAGAKSPARAIIRVEQAGASNVASEGCERAEYKQNKDSYTYDLMVHASFSFLMLSFVKKPSSS